MGYEYDEDNDLPSLDDITQPIKDGKNAYDTFNELNNRFSKPQGKEIGSNNNPANNQANNLPGKEISQSPSPTTPSGAEVTNAGSNVSSSVGSQAGNVGSQAAGQVGSQAVGQATGQAVGQAAGQTAAVTASGAIEGGTIATGVATGTGTAGIGFVVAGAVAVGSAGKNIARKVEKQLTDAISNRKGSSLGTFLSIGIATLSIILLVAALTLTPSAIFSAVVKDVKDNVTTFFISYTDKAKFFAELFEEERYNVEINEAVNSQSGVDSQNARVYKAIIDKAIDTSFKNYMKETIRNPKTVLENIFEILGATTYCPNTAMDNYKGKPYPYNLAITDGTYYTVGDYLGDVIPADELNNDLNYAEIIAIYCQHPDRAYTNISFSEFYDSLVDGEDKSLFYELEISDKPTWFYYDEYDNLIIVETKQEAFEGYLAAKIVRDEREASGDNSYIPKRQYKDITGEEEDSSENEEDSSEKKDDTVDNTNLYRPFGYFYDVKVAPYGLQEMYAAAEVDMMGKNGTYVQHFNLLLLDQNELWLRSYIETMVDLGPSYTKERLSNSTSHIYYIEQDYTPTYRSLDYYLENTVTQKFIDGDVPDYGTGGDGIIIDYDPTGDSVILNMPDYINQGMYPNDLRGPGPDTIKKSGCCDCSYTMCAEYYNNEIYNIVPISKKYVKADMQFQTGTFMAHYGFNERRTVNTFSTSEIVSHLTSGNPVILYIKGRWVGADGRVLHKSDGGHFLVITGYDAVGFYFHDPGSRDNTYGGAIPFEDFKNVTIKGVRYMNSSNPGFTPRYKVNTLQE